MRYRAQFIKRKRDNAYKLFTTQVKRWFVLDTDEGYFGYSRKKEGKLRKRYELSQIEKAAIYVDHSLKKKKKWNKPFFVKTNDREFVIIA